MLSKQTIASSIKAMEFLAKRISETVTYNEEQYLYYLKALEKKEAITISAGGFTVKEEFNEHDMVRSLKLHNETVLKNKPLLEEYMVAIAELKAL